MNVKLKDLININNITPKKKLGQNFIFDNNILDKIAKSLLPITNHTIIEIGPGPGGLTRAILKYKPENLITIEKDVSYKRILLDLHKDFLNTDILLIFDDFMKIDLSKLNKNPIKIYSNLPYYIATQILIKILPLKTNNIDEVVFTFQKEVAERILALPGSKKYSRLSVLCQYACKVEKICYLSAKVFYPIPKVNSTVIKFIPNDNIDNKIFSNLQYLTKLAFGKRRKMLKNSLSEISDISFILKKANIKSTARAEDLTIKEFIILSDMIDPN